MASPRDKAPKFQGDMQVFPFESAEEAWFWFIQAQAARNDGARFTAGISLRPRPCEPVDILGVLDRLYRNRRLHRDHFLVLRHYGRRQLPPDPDRVKESRAYGLWAEALERMEPLLEKKGIVKRPFSSVRKTWGQAEMVLEGMAAE